MFPYKISENLYYLGVNDRTKELFENLWPIPLGVSYNSYLLTGDKTVLIDTVDICYSDVFLSKLEKALNGKNLDYLIINHMEPDHSGSIRLLQTKYPEVQIVGNARTADMVKGYFGISENVQVIKDGDELTLGKQTLRFYLTPMVHWPETMMTYETSEKILFSGDAFGTFGALDGGITDKVLIAEKYWNEMIRYYSNIVGKFGSPVQKALEKLSATEIRIVCSTHGPVWSKEENIKKVVSLYDKLSKYEADKGVVIAYGSMYGHTAQIAEIIACELSAQGIRDIIIHNVSKSSHSEILRDVFKYKGLIAGCPTYNNQLFPEMECLLSKIQGKEIKNRIFGYFGSYTWAGAAVKRLAAFAESSGWELLEEVTEMKQSMNNETYNSALKLAADMAAKLNK